MKKFNQMTEVRMSNVNGGAVILLPIFTTICGAIGLAKTIADLARK